MILFRAFVIFDKNVIPCESRKPLIHKGFIVGVTGFEPMADVKNMVGEQLLKSF